MKLVYWLVSHVLAEICRGRFTFDQIRHSLLLDKHCFFELDLRYRFTMSCHDKKGLWFPAEFDKNGIKQAADNQYYFKESDRRFDETNCIFGNGEKHALITINGKSPPPPLEVEVGSMLHVTVSLLLYSIAYYLR